MCKLTNGTLRKCEKTDKKQRKNENKLLENGVKWGFLKKIGQNAF